MTSTKTQLLQELDSVRDYLWDVLKTIDPAAEIYPDWVKRDFFAHIAGWEVLVFEALREYLTGISSKSYLYSDLDTANKDFVSMRRNSTAANVQLEAEAYRFAIKTMLSGIPADHYLDLVRFPWGQETISAFLQGAVDHERNHADEIASLNRDRQLTRSE